MTYFIIFITDVLPQTHTKLIYHINSVKGLVYIIFKCVYYYFAYNHRNISESIEPQLMIMFFSRCKTTITFYVILHLAFCSHFLHNLFPGYKLYANNPN